MERVYSTILEEHIQDNRQMAFLSGPRQVGKTTVACFDKTGRHCIYINWDNQSNRKIILKGPDAIKNEFDLDMLKEEVPVIIFGEIHKYTKWKSFLKQVLEKPKSENLFQ